MQRAPEVEVMADPQQALAYARADFSEPHNRFVELFRERIGATAGASVLDLGCGFGDYGLHAGARADLVLVDAQTVAQAVVARPQRKLVVSNGRIVARNGELLDTF